MAELVSMIKLGAPGQINQDEISGRAERRNRRRLSRNNVDSISDDDDENGAIT